MTFDPTAQDGDHEETDLLTIIKQHGEELTRLNKLREVHTTIVSNISEKMRDISEQVLPDLMGQAGISEIKLEDGTKITKYEFISTRLKDERAAFKWLRDKGEDSIIKNVITVPLGKGDDVNAELLDHHLRDLGLHYQRKESIHPSTLKAFVKEALNNETLSQDFPRDAFGVYEGEAVKFK